MGKSIRNTDDGLPIFSNDEDVLTVTHNDDGLPVFSKKKVGGVPLFSGSNNLQTCVQNGTSNTSPSKYPSISGWKKEPTQLS